MDDRTQFSQFSWTRKIPPKRFSQKSQLRAFGMTIRQKTQDFNVFYYAFSEER